MFIRFSLKSVLVSVAILALVAWIFSLRIERLREKQDAIVALREDPWYATCNEFDKGGYWVEAEFPVEEEKFSDFARLLTQLRSRINLFFVSIRDDEFRKSMDFSLLPPIRHLELVFIPRQEEFETFPKIDYLSLYSDDIDDAAIIRIAHALPKLKGLSIATRNPGVTTKGLTSALPKFQNLRWLSLDVSYQFDFQCLKGCDSLKQLEVCGGDLAPKDIDSILKNCDLEVLCLFSVTVRDNSLELLINENSLEEIFLHHTPLSSNVVESLEEAGIRVTIGQYVLPY